MSLRKRKEDENYEDENSLVLPSKRICQHTDVSTENKYDMFKKLLQDKINDDLANKRQESFIIQARLLKAEKILHFLKYVIIQSFYNAKHLRLIKNEDTYSEYEVNKTYDNQSRIHPAIKGKIGKKPMLHDANQTSTDYSLVAKQESGNLDILNCQINNEKAEQNSEPNETTQSDKCIVRNKEKVKYRIIVGNISKWISSDSSKDSCTHKWMVYVRGSKDRPDINDVVKKVRFFLHPSYHPNDIVEVMEPPFQLTRRGWGEFPLRVQLHFHNGFNKPVDIIHSLRLDRTYSGHQTLGNETLVDVWIYSEEKDSNILNKVEDKLNFYTKNDLLQNSLSLSNTTFLPDIKNIPIFSNYDNKFNDESKEEIDTYSASELDFKELHNVQNLYLKKTFKDKQISSANFHQDASNDYRDVNLYHLVDHCYTKPVNTIDIIEYDQKDNIINLPINMGENVTQIVFFLLKCLPLVAIDHNKIICKIPQPYVANSVDEFLKWNHAKRCCCEWFRAKQVKKLLSHYNLPESEKWTVKMILMYGRMCGFTPVINCDFKNTNEGGKTIPARFSKFVLPNTYTEAVPFKELMQMDKDDTIEDEIVNVEDIIEDVVENTNKVIPKEETVHVEVEEKLILPCQFISENAKVLGINLPPEEINGTHMNVTERMLLKVIMSFSEELIRKALANKAIRSKGRLSDTVIETEDVLSVLVQRPEFDLFLNTGLGKT